MGLEATACRSPSSRACRPQAESPVCRHAIPDSVPRVGLASAGLPVAFATAGLLEVGGGLVLESWALLAEGMRQCLLGVGVIALQWAKRLSARKPTERLSFGFGRAMVLVKLLMAVISVVLSTTLIIACLLHETAKLDPPGSALLVFALFALGVGLQGPEPTLLRRAAGRLVNASLSGPAISLVAAAGMFAWWGTGWWPADRIAALLVLLAIAYGSSKAMWLPLCELMSACPQEVDMQRMEHRILAQPGVTCLHDLHVWSICGEQRWLSAHVGIACIQDWPPLQRGLQRVLRDEFGIGHSTLQPEPPEYRVLAALRSRAGSPLDDHAH